MLKIDKGFLTQLALKSRGLDETTINEAIRILQEARTHSSYLKVGQFKKGNVVRVDGRKAKFIGTIERVMRTKVRVIHPKTREVYTVSPAFCTKLA